MAKFIDKKEQVYDLKLTSYGHYLLSVGKFKPEYYAFFDNNILYDGKYADITEKQNDISKRIKKDTHYLESLVLFEDVESTLNNSFETDSSGNRYFSVDITPTMVKPRKDSFRFTSIIGDAHLQADKQSAPAWKVVSLDGRIMSSSLIDVKNDVKIPQVNVHLDYVLSIKEYDANEVLTDNDLQKTSVPTQVFADNKVINLDFDHLLLYTEEENTDMLSENFEIEVFDIEFNGVPALGDAEATDKLIRKYFPEDFEKIMGGLLTDESQFSKYDDVLGTDYTRQERLLTTGSVEYYFDILKDHEINKEVACKASEIFNYESLYIDLDFDCYEESEYSSRYIDIYGPTTEPEICP